MNLLNDGLCALNTFFGDDLFLACGLLFGSRGNLSCLGAWGFLGRLDRTDFLGGFGCLGFGSLGRTGFLGGFGCLGFLALAGLAFLVALVALGLVALAGLAFLAAGLPWVW